MAVMITKQVKMEEEMKTQVGQQGQLLRGKGFLRVNHAELKKGFERALAQIHVYSRLGGTDQYDAMIKMQQCRAGDHDSSAKKALGIK